MKVSRYTKIVYIERYLLLICIERFFSTVCCFFSYICWSVNFTIWVSKFSNFFLTCMKTETRFIFDEFKYYPLWKVHVQYSYFFRLFYLVCKLFKRVFQSLFQPVNCLSWVFESQNISRRCPVAQALIYIWDLVLLLLKVLSVCTVCTMSELSGLWIVNIWSINYALHFGSVNIDQNCLYWSVFSTDINRKIIFDCLLLFKLFWLDSKFYELSQ